MANQGTRKRTMPPRAQGRQPGREGELHPRQHPQLSMTKVISDLLERTFRTDIVNG